MKYVDRTDYVPELDAPEELMETKPTRPPKARAKNDPKQVAAARELRDRALEFINGDVAAMLADAKYDVARVLPAAPASSPAKLLPHAA